MAKLKVEPMRGTLPVCLFCGLKPRDEEGNIYDALTADGVDVNWGDTPYICYNCMNLGCQLMFGLKPGEVQVEHERMTKQLEFRNQQVEKLQKQIEKRERQIEKMIEGKKALAEVKKERKDAK